MANVGGSRTGERGPDTSVKSQGAIGFLNHHREAIGTLSPYVLQFYCSLSIWSIRPSGKNADD